MLNIEFIIILLHFIVCFNLLLLKIPIPFLYYDDYECFRGDIITVGETDLTYRVYPVLNSEFTAALLRLMVRLDLLWHKKSQIKYKIGSFLF